MSNYINVPFSTPDITEAEVNAVASVLRSAWITTGAVTKKFESELCKFLNVNKCACLNSQTACSEMALRLLGVGEGDEVIVPAYTYTATASVVCHVGATLKIVDSQKDNVQIDYNALENAITEKTKVVIPVDIAGLPCDYDKIFEIVEKKKSLFKPSNEIQKAIGRVIVLADTAHALGSKYKGKMVGSVADFSAFSFHAVKNLTTAEGGALTWKSINGISDEEIYKKIQLLSLHGQSKDAFQKNQLGTWEYDVIGTWYKCNMTDVAAAMGVSQLARYEQSLARRKQIITAYDNAFKPLGVKVLNHYTSETESSGHLYITKIKGITCEQRNEIIIEMAKKGICCNVHYKPLPMLTAYKNLGFDIKDYPNAYDYFESEITLPLHTCLTDEQVEYVIKTFTEILNGYGINANN